MSSRPERVEPSAGTLSGLEYFASLDEPARAELAMRCRAARFPQGWTVVNHGDHDTDVYFVAAGRARATIMSADGKIVSFRDIEPGEAFGDLSAIDGLGRSADVVTTEPSLIVSMPASVFWETIERHPSVARFALVGLAGLVRLLSERVAEFGLLGAKARICAELLRLARAVPGEPNTGRIEPAPTQAEIGHRVSVRREGVAREVHRLIETGLVVREGRALLVPDLEALATLVRELKGE